MEFAILTNGRTINIYDKSFKAIKDIPETALSEEDEIYSNFNFIALKEGYDCSLAISEYENKLNIIEGKTVRNFFYEDLTKVPVIGKISVGIGIDMVEELLNSPYQRYGAPIHLCLKLKVIV